MIDFDKLDDEEVEELRARGAAHGLSPAQVHAADRFGMDVRAYATFGGVRSVDDYARLRREEALRAEAERAVALNAAKAALKAGR